MAAQLTSGIVHPHDHDVLAGRGNFVNYHAGNEHFRHLVRKYKVDYVQCPKPQKGKFSKLIVDEIQNRTPPGRFLKQDSSTKLWYDIGEKKAMDKTRQALREGAPDLVKEIKGDDTGSDGEDRTVQKNVIGNASVGGFSSPHFHPGGFQSPVMNMRNHLHNSPAAHMLSSPPLLSPGVGMMMNSRMPSPAIPQPLSAMSWHGGNMGQMLPSPQVHRRSSLDDVAQSISSQQQQMMMMSQQAAMNQQAINQQRMNQQALNNGSNALQQYNKTQAELENAIIVNAKLEQEMQMMQNKLNAIYSDHQMSPTPLNTGSINRTPVSTNMMAPISPKLELPTGQNSRRKPPPSLLVREDSLKLDRLFPSPGSVMKKKVDNNGSSGGLSAMSLSLADMHDEGNLSAVFDTSVRISDAGGHGDKNVKRQKKAEFDMSIATLGETGNMSVNTLSMHESDGNVSFGNVFEHPYKLE